MDQDNTRRGWNTWASCTRKRGEACGGRPGRGGERAAKTVKRPPQRPAQPPVRQLLGSANAATTTHGTPAAAAQRSTSRDERVTVQGPGKKPQPDGILHGGHMGGRFSSPKGSLQWMLHGACTMRSAWLGQACAVTCTQPCAWTRPTACLAPGRGPTGAEVRLWWTAHTRRRIPGSGGSGRCTQQHRDCAVAALGAWLQSMGPTSLALGPQPPSVAAGQPHQPPSVGRQGMPSIWLTTGGRSPRARATFVMAAPHASRWAHRPGLSHCVPLHPNSGAHTRDPRFQTSGNQRSPQGQARPRSVIKD